MSADTIKAVRKEMPCHEPDVDADSSILGAPIVGVIVVDTFATSNLRTIYSWSVCVLLKVVNISGIQSRCEARVIRRVQGVNGRSIATAQLKRFRFAHMDGGHSRKKTKSTNTWLTR